MDPATPQPSLPAPKRAPSAPGRATPAPGRAPSTPDPERRAWTLRTLALTALLMANELWVNLAHMGEQFSGGKVFRSIDSDLGRLAPDLLVGALGLLLGATLLAALPAALWAGAGLVAGRRLERVVARAWLRRALGLAGLVAFLNVLYGLHQAVFPASRLADSPLAMLVGSLRTPWRPSWTEHGPLLLAAPVVLFVLVDGCWHSRRLRRASAGVLALVLCAVVLAEALHAPPDHPATRVGGNIVVVGLDSFALERLQAGGQVRPLAPHVDAFLEQSLLFENVFTPLARTYASWLSILTGRDPTTHGARFNLVPDHRLADDNRYLAQELSAAGMHTFHATDETRFSIIRERFGYDQLMHPRMGLQDFVLGTAFDFSSANLARLTHLGHDLFPPLRHNRAVVSYSPRIFVDTLLARLDALPGDAPSFVNLHLCGNHWPFAAPAPWAATSLDPVEACIAMVDDQVGRILEYVDASGFGRDSTVALLSDHGDGWSGTFGDDTNFHGDTVETIASNRTFLALRAPGLPPGRRRDTVRSYDLYPTLLELAGRPVPAGIDGRSLLPLVHGSGEPSPRPVFAESGLERRVYTLKQLVERNARWYGVDADSGLLTLRDDGFEEFVDLKSYSLIDGDLRLAVTPALKRFRLFAFDAERGRDGTPDPAVGEPRRLALLDELVHHYGLDRRALLDAARWRGYLGRAEGTSSEALAPTTEGAPP